MTDRERLIALIKKAEKQELRDFIAASNDELIDMSGGTQLNGSVEYLADYLVKNGVQKVFRCKDCAYFEPYKDEDCREYGNCYCLSARYIEEVFFCASYSPQKKAGGKK